MLNKFVNLEIVKWPFLPECGVVSQRISIKSGGEVNILELYWIGWLIDIQQSLKKIQQPQFGYQNLETVIWPSLTTASVAFFGKPRKNNAVGLVI